MPVYVSERGLGLLKERIRDVQAGLARTREEKTIAYTASGDTWHDNPGFNALEQQEGRQARELADLQRKLVDAVVYLPGPDIAKSVRLGSIVCCERQIGRVTNVDAWEIVGFGEAEPEKRRVSYESPVGGALLGLGVGDTVTLVTPRGPAEYTVLGLYETWDAAKADGR